MYHITCSNQITLNFYYLEYMKHLKKSFVDFHDFSQLQMFSYLLMSLEEWPV